jgi:hypothetical protein
MSFPFGNMFGAVVEDVNVPEGQVWFYSRKPVAILTPLGQSYLSEPDAKIVNIGREPSKLDWVPAPH